MPIYYSGGTSSSDVERSVTHSFSAWGADDYVELALSDYDVIGTLQYFDFPDIKSGASISSPFGSIVIKEFNPHTREWEVPQVVNATGNTKYVADFTSNVDREIPAGSGNIFGYTRFKYRGYQYLSAGTAYRGATTIRVYLS